MKKIFLLTAIPVFFGIGLLFSSKVSALTTEFPEYDVEIDINEDSTFEVTERAIYRFNGELNGIRRDITLHDTNRAQRCSENVDLSCGGFEFIILNSVILDGKELDEDEYDLYEVTEENGSRYLRVEKRIFDEATEVNNEEFEFEINYTVYGGIQWLEKDNEEIPIFYWNLLPETRQNEIEDSVIEINFPRGVDIERENFEIYYPFLTIDEEIESYLGDNVPPNTSYVRTSFNNNSINLKGKNIYSGYTITAAYFFNEDELTKTGEVIIEFDSPYLNNEIYYEDERIIETNDREFTLKYFPSGNQELEFKHIGYENKSIEVDVNPGETSRIEVKLEPKTWMRILLLTNTIEIIAGLLLIPIVIVYALKRARNKGRDINMPKTIVPTFSPPKDVHPYLLGSLKDEKVDKIDITGSIIDLAYKGFIKIKELKKGKNYELTKLDKDRSELDKIEKAILDALFDSKDKVETNKLTYTFVKKIKEIEKDIYEEMVKRGYFTKSPKTTRENNIGLGIVLFILGIAGLIGISIGASILLGVISIFTVGLAMSVLGIFLIITAKYIPAKTELGSKTYAEILGFKMYMQTAERFTVQKLEPEDFVKYLSYAIVFGIEKEWAEKFKDIYKSTPEWYEGGTLTDVILISSFSRSFANATTERVSTLSTSSGRGGGWSGGGSFGGGFSGGGGGGGGAGGW